MSDRTPELEAALEREAATREILRVINRSPGDYQPVFEAILENAARLCDAPLGFLLIREVDGFHFVAERGCTPETLEYFRANPLPLDPEHSVTARTAVERRPMQVPDVAAHPLSQTGQPHRRLGVEVERVRTQLTVPMLRGDECIGVILVYRREVRAFEDDQVALLSTFADQAVIAIENVRRFKALGESLERQTATSEILRSISRSPTDYAPVFDTILENAVRLCGAPFGTLFLLRDGYLQLVADAGSRREMVEHLRANPIALDEPDAISSRAARDQVPRQIADMMDEAYRSGDPRRRAAVETGGIRTWLAVPMLKGEETVGVIALYRQEVKPFADDDIALVSTFADQAVIAIENVRQFQQVQARTADLSRSLERQTATSEILRSISRSPTDHAPVFDTILENAANLCGAPFATLFLLRDDHLHMAADSGAAAPEFLEHMRANPIPMNPSGPAGPLVRAAKEHAPVQFDDIVDDRYRSGEPIRAAAVEIGKIRTLLGVPLLKGEETVGVIALYRQEVKPFADDDIALVRTFADQAVIAIENVRQFQQVQERTADLTRSLERQTATSEILRSISRSPTDYAPVFDTILQNAVRLCGAPFGTLFLLRDGHLHAVADAGSRPDFIEYLRANPFPLDHRTSYISRTAREKVPVLAADLRDEAYRAGDPRRVTAVEIGGLRTQLTVPMLKGEETVGVVALYRQEVKPFADEHIELVTTFADQAVIAIENVRLFQALEDRNTALDKSLERQTATSEILRAINRSPTDYQPVFDVILDNALRLCRAPRGNLLLLRDGHLHLVSSAGETSEFIEHMKANPLSIDRPNSVTGRAAREQVVVNVPDMVAEQHPADAAQSRVVKLSGTRSLLAVPILRGEVTVGVLALYRQEVKPFADDDVVLVRTFADQAVIAIENVRQFQQVQARTADLTQSLERQTATSEILRTISQSPTDYGPVFDAILDNATRLCDAPLAFLLMREGDAFHFVAHHGSRPEFTAFLRANPVPADSQGALAAVAGREGVPMQLEDITDSEAYRSGNNIHRVASADIEGIRTALFVPMMKGKECVGIIALYRREVRAFQDSHLALVSTFADQAVIAIDNVRLFQTLEARTAALTRTLERQTATSEILRSISRSPTDYRPVFDTILDNATRLCGAPFGTLYLLGDDQWHCVADAGSRPELVVHMQANPLPRADTSTVVGSAASKRAPVQVTDLMEDAKRSGNARRIASAEMGGVRTLLGVPLLKNDEAVGVMTLYRQQVERFAEDDIELVSTFADQAVIAIENVRLFQAVESRSKELARSVAELEALGDVAQAVSSSLDVQTVLDTIVERAVQLSDAHAGAINEMDEATGTLPPRAAPGVEEMLSLPAPRLGEGALGRAAATHTPVQIPDITVPGAYTGRLLDTLSHLKIRALLAVPMIQDEKVIGTLTVARRTPGEFPPETVRLLRALGTQSAIAIRNARLYREIEEQSRELEAANRHKSEFLANMSHELRTPLNAVIGFSEVLGERMFGELNDKQAEYVTDIHDSGRHLLSLINDILDLSKIEAGAMELDIGRFALGPALDNALTLMKERAGRRGITLEPQVAGDLGEMEGDERKLKQILLNLLSNAIKFTDAGGKVTLEAMGDGTSVHIAVRDTGVGISPEDQAVIFDEFKQVGTDYARKVEGTGLGLTLTRRFVEMHGGSLSVESEPGVGSVFRVTLPLRPPEPQENAQ